jgi:hypothetical protein
MAEVGWYKCKFLESVENLKPLVKKRFGREPSSSLARELVACLQQGRLFYEAAASSALEIRPLQQFYGMIGFSKAIIVASQFRSLSTLKPAHGLTDISAANCRIADLRVKVETTGTFQEFNDVVAGLTRFSYIDHETRTRVLYIPSAKSSDIRGIELTLREILSRTPGLESLYQMTFDEEPQTAMIGLEAPFQDDENFRLRIDDPQLFDSRGSLQNIVTRWRAKFPFLKTWRLTSAQQGWGKSIIYFRNMGNANIEEFSEAYLAYENASFQEHAVPDDKNDLFALEQAFDRCSRSKEGYH